MKFYVGGKPHVSGIKFLIDNLLNMPHEEVDFGMLHRYVFHCKIFTSSDIDIPYPYCQARQANNYYNIFILSRYPSNLKLCQELTHQSSEYLVISFWY